MERMLVVSRLLLRFILFVAVAGTTHSVWADAAIDERLGKAAYMKANCIGCHKWHGGGGGGYGGVALSLRATQLDRAGLMMVVRCGRPGTHMPYHDRKAYIGDNRDCYESTKAELGDALPPPAPRSLREPEIMAVVDFVQRRIQGRGLPDYEDCVAFWGADATRCRRMTETQEGEKGAQND